MHRIRCAAATDNFPELARDSAAWAFASKASPGRPSWCSRAGSITRFSPSFPRTNDRFSRSAEASAVLGARAEPGGSGRRAGRLLDGGAGHARAGHSERPGGGAARQAAGHRRCRSGCAPRPRKIAPRWWSARRAARAPSCCWCEQSGDVLVDGTQGVQSKPQIVNLLVQRRRRDAHACSGARATSRRPSTRPSRSSVLAFVVAPEVPFAGGSLVVSVALLATLLVGAAALVALGAGARRVLGRDLRRAPHRRNGAGRRGSSGKTRAGALGRSGGPVGGFVQRAGRSLRGRRGSVPPRPDRRAELRQGAQRVLGGAQPRAAHAA